MSLVSIIIPVAAVVALSVLDSMIIGKLRHDLRIQRETVEYWQRLYYEAKDELRGYGKGRYDP